MFNILRKLVRAFGVSGYESDISMILENEIGKYTDSVRKDPMGNLIAVKRTGNTANPEKIMLVAHMDTVGIIVTHVDDKGYIRFSNIGGLKPHCCIGQTVEFPGGLRGVIYYEASINDMKDVKIGSLFIDTGLDPDEVTKKIKPGTYGAFEFQTYTQGDSVISGYLDDRAGCAILLDVAKNVSEEVQAGEFSEDKEIYFAFTVQEELGLRGAGPAAYSINPDIAISVDVTHSEDIPGYKNGNVFMGKGPVIQIKDAKTIYHTYIRDRLKTVADELNIPYQYGITDKGGTDAGAVHTSLGGIVTGGISVASRYIHTPSEMCSIKDLRNAAELLTAAVKVKR